MTFTYRNRKKILVISLVLCLVVLLSCFTLSKWFRQKKVEKKETIVLAKKVSKEKKEASSPKKTIYFQVDIKGAVLNPGIYSVEEGSRVIDVIRLAGDLLTDADTTVLNLSKKVFDEMVIIVYTQEEVSRFKEVKEIEEEVQKKCQSGIEGTLSNDACIGVEKEEMEMGKISLNQATKEELMTLSGIGESKAEAILKYREEHGGFQAIEELKEVSGIGDALFNQVKENLTL